MSYEVKIIAVSQNTEGKRLITMELKYPRMIHSEFMTHRVFSRNASSSRAIPIDRLIQDVMEDTAYPVYWGENMRGMQAKIEIRNLIDGLDPARAWRKDAVNACQVAKKWASAGYHKQIVNRKIENYGHIRVVVTATEWDNFFNLRCHEDAQPEIRALATMMQEKYSKVLEGTFPSTLLVTPLEDWHLPYIAPEELGEHDLNTLIKCSVARCARVSYLNHNKKKPSLDDDLRLYQMLAESRHMSPFEHQATCFNSKEVYNEKLCGMIFNNQDFDELEYEKSQGITHIDIYGNLWSGNFKGFSQYRQIFDYNCWNNMNKNTDNKFNLNNI